MTALFLAWQDLLTNRWFPVGRLEYSDGLYSFAYTKGAVQAQIEAGFQTLPSFPELFTLYVSEQLFPLFSNRLVPRSRPQYREYLHWLGLPESESDPISVLSRSGGSRVTDTLEIFPSPEKDCRGEYQVHFFVNGLNKMPGAAMDRALEIKSGERLLAMPDFQNPQDPQAIALRTDESSERDIYLIGYCPRYLRADFLRLLKSNAGLTITVEGVNPPPAPTQFRVLCKSVIHLPEGLKPFSTDEYQPLVPASAAVTPRVPLATR
jgi:hypothetical protein